MSGGEAGAGSLAAGLLRLYGSNKNYVLVRLKHQFVRYCVVLYLNGNAEYRTMGGVLQPANAVAIARGRSIARSEVAWRVVNGAVITALIFDMEDEGGCE